MPLPINKFYSDEKSIQRSYNFLVTINNDESGFSYLPNGEQMPKIESHHVLNVSVPQYGFKKEIQYHGPYPMSFPVLEHEGFEIKITFEEDNKGTISNLVNWLQRRIIYNDGSGRYVPPRRNRIQSIFIQVVDTVLNSGEVINEILRYEFTNCYFLRASEPNYDYGTNESIKYEIVFGSDFQIYTR